ncbi:hypothetical protein ACQ4PT_028839 [Festuca glaucescens]
MSWSYNNIGFGKKTSWPEVVGMPTDEAEKIIRKDKPDAIIIVKPIDSPMFLDRWINRVHIFVSTVDGVPLVTLTPRVE